MRSPPGGGRQAYLKSVDLLEMDRQAPVPIKILLRYLRATKLVYNIGMCMSLFTAKDGAVNPIAQKIFQAIDKDNDKVLTTDEVIAYFVTEYGPDPSLKLLKVLDSDGASAVAASNAPKPATPSPWPPSLPRLHRRLPALPGQRRGRLLCVVLVPIVPSPSAVWPEGLVSAPPCDRWAG